MIDPIADMLTKIRNAQRAGLKDVLVSFSKVKLAIAKILEKEGFVEFVSEEKNETGKFKNIRIGLKYYRLSQTQKRPAIRQLERVSHEGQRIYVRKKDLKPVKNNFGLAIVSTSQGVMTSFEARKKSLGGEYLCRVW